MAIKVANKVVTIKDRREGNVPAPVQLGIDGYTPPPWPLTEENGQKTIGWCAYQDFLHKETSRSAAGNK